MTNVNEVSEMVEMVESVENSLVKDSPKMDVEGLTKWLKEFRQTHYKTRPITRHFWSICILGLEMGIDVREVLGEKILTDLKRVEPYPFEMFLTKPFIEKDVRLKQVNFHL